MKKNLGFAFVSFKEKDCVTDTLEEIDLVKLNLIDDKKTKKLWIQNWTVQNAYKPSDIIWNELQNISNPDSFTKSLGIILANLGISTVLFSFFIFLESLDTTIDAFNIVIRYVSPMVLGFYILYLHPQIVFRFTQQENHDRKSLKETSFLSKHNFMLVFNMMMAPFLAGLILLEIFPDKGAPKG